MTMTNLDLDQITANLELTPLAARRRRIRDLEDLLDTVNARLTHERLALARTLRLTPPVLGNPDGQPSPIRVWARAHGWPNLATSGRIPDDVKDAYTKAHPNRTQDHPA